ncbi:MAG: hypothetical protein ACI8XO_000140 [Verrucomicrobiales bacterium]|jgi:hypothetical protein
MNRKLTTFFCAVGIAFGLLANAGAELHSFTSADDETKTFLANLVSFDAKSDKVMVRRSNGRKMVFPAAKLIGSDREWVKEQYEIIKIGRNVKIDAKVQHGRRKVTKSSSKKAIETSKYFDIEISNTSSEEVSELTIKYEIHVSQGGERGVIKGDDQAISTLYSGVPHRFQSTEVNLSQRIPLSTSSGGAGCST